MILYQVEISEGLILLFTDKSNTQIYLIVPEKVQAFDIFAMPHR